MKIKVVCSERSGVTEWQRVKRGGCGAVEGGWKGRDVGGMTAKER